MPRLSLIVITKNEEASILRCLRSVPFSDEIVVVDSGSTDRTVALAREAGATVLEPADWPGFGPQKQRALDAANGDWILSLDADEWIDAGLASEIRRVIAEPDALDGYRMPRRNRFCGEIVRFGGWSPDYVLRLFRKNRGHFSSDLVHERVIVEGSTGTLAAPIEHNTIVSLADADDKIRRYAAVAASSLVVAGRRSSMATARLRGAAAFLRSYVLQLGFLDGRTGFRVARYQARYTREKWAGVAAGRR